MVRERTPEQWRKTINGLWPNTRKVICLDGFTRLKRVVETEGRTDGRRGAGKPYKREITVLSRTTKGVKKIDAYVLGDTAERAEGGPARLPSRENFWIPPFHAVPADAAPFGEKRLFVSYDGRHFFRTNKRMKDSVAIAYIRPDGRIEHRD